MVERRCRRMKNDKMITQFVEGSIPKQLAKFATPLFLSSLLQMMYNMIDMIIVGHALGKTGLSAVAVGSDISNFITFFIMGFSNAGQVIISQYIGADQRDKLGKFIANMFSALIISSVLMSVVCLFFRETFLGMMNTPTEAYGEALAYSTVCISGLIFISGYNMISAVMRGMGDSKHPFVFIAIASVLNIVLDILFVIGMKMGSAGAALATVISQGVSFILCLLFMYKRRHQLGFDITLKDFISPDKGMLASLAKLGFPMAIKSTSIHFSKLFVNSWINSYGVAVSAFAGVANKLSSISNLISNSVNTAGSSMVGQNIAAKKFGRVSKIMATIGVFVFAVSTLLSVIIISFPDQVFGIFTTDEAVLAIGREYIFVAVLMFYGSAARAPMNALLNGSGDYKINFVTAILDGIVMRIGLSVLFGIALGMGYIGFWLGDALAGFTPLFIGAVFYITGKWKKQNIV